MIPQLYKADMINRKKNGNGTERLNCRMQIKSYMNDGGVAATVRLPDERQSEWTKTISERTSN
jgi:hypothetical protein